MQVAAVDDVHDVLVHNSAFPSRAEGVLSSKPKFRPSTVTEAPPLSGLLMCAALATGLSSEKPVRTNVPTCELTVS